ncbi:MAG: hypothetical protein ACLPHI_00590 [Terriglobales bacterium]|jgi:hypothetical protein
MPNEKSGDADYPDLPGEPEGWRELQERARKERDPRKLEAIIGEMNRLLSESEKKAAVDGARAKTTRPVSDKPPSSSNPD